ncbi:DnaJ family domain-containing protein [Saccharopolyspora tripterygii]
MAERKPPGVTFESWVDRQIRTAQERGEFDDLPGAGKPLPGAGAPLEEQWWIKEQLRREGLSGSALLPTSLRLRREVGELPETVADLTTEQAVRDVAAELNRRIVEHLRAPEGPQVAVAPVDVDALVEGWRAQRVAPLSAEPEPQPAPTRPKSRVRRWFQR